MSKRILVGGLILPITNIYTSVKDIEIDGSSILIGDTDIIYTVCKRFDTEVYILTGCVEHEQLKRLIDSKDNVAIEDYIDELVIEHLTTKEILEAIENIEQQAFDEGFKKSQEQIRKAIGI